MSKVYPNLEGIVQTENNHHRFSGNLEANCGQIFTKGKDIIEKIEESNLGGPKTAVICGRKFNTRQLWVLVGLLLLFLSSCMGMVLMMFTTMFDTYVLSNLVLKNNTFAYNTWKDPPNLYLKIYIFNYTNINEYENGEAEKLNVNEVGPYVYEESSKKFDIKFNQNGTITYRDLKTHKFRADLSKGRRQSDHLTVPNTPVLGAAAVSKHSYYFTRFAMSTLLQSLSSNLFINLPADRFIWGYDDSFYSLAKGVMAFHKKLPYEKCGILAPRNNSYEHLITINTGATDINKLKQIDNFNGETELNYWSTDECNKIQVWDGTAFPPHLIRRKEPVYVYQKDLCRAVPYVFEKEVKIINGKVPAYRYVLQDTVFDTPETQPENQCFCDMDSGNCALKGVFNVTACVYGAPGFISFPHFYNGDPSLREAITGLNPKNATHQNYIDIHPTLGFAMAGRSMLQVNVQIKKSFGMSQLNMYDDDMILPLAWVDIGIDDNDLPNSIKEDIYTFSITIPLIETALKYGCMLTAIVTLIALIIVLQRKWSERILRLKKQERSTML